MLATMRLVEVSNFESMLVSMPKCLWQGNLLERRVAGPLADAVDRHLDLAGSADHAFERVGRRHAQIVMAMGRNDRAVDVGHMLDKIPDLAGVLLRQAIARRIGNVDDRRPSPDHGLDHAREVLVVGTPGVFGIELDVLDILFRMPDGRHGPLDDLLRRGIELVIDMRVRHADARMYPLVLGQSQRVGRHVDIVLHGPRQRADRRPGNGLRYLPDRIEVAGARHGKAGLDDIHAQRLKRPSHFHFFDRIELAAGNLFPVAQRRVENVQFLAHDFSSLFNNVPKSHCYKISPIVKFYLELQIYKYDT